ncbi:MAG: hypothetical protein L6R36_001223 [Xanthoria steineri]|nr:MAG: hypothetical protein L6R36_001223 [Xanthoria steineri]
MNSLNLLSSRVIGQPAIATKRPGNYRRRSFSDGNIGKTHHLPRPKRSASQHVKRESSTESLAEKDISTLKADDDGEAAKTLLPAMPPTEYDIDEKGPSITYIPPETKPDPRYYQLQLAARRLVKALVNSIQFVISALAAPGVYASSCLHDDNGLFSPLRPVRKLGRVLYGRGGSQSTAQAVGLSASPSDKKSASAKSTNGNRRTTSLNSRTKRLQAGGSNPLAASATDSDIGEASEATRSNTQSALVSSSSDEGTPVRRSIRIKLYNEDHAQKRRVKRAPTSAPKGDTSTKGKGQEPSLTVATIKSPTSPASSMRMTIYPRAPAPPRPLIPPRQSSYSTSRSSASRVAQKTLVIDLDETLIHSLAKGGRMSSGHMVEVKLNTTVGYGGATLGPQHPILYYVHKRPHCDDFLRKVCKWYDLVVFTASVQEYADPVIDWLEQEKKYFSRRYYRQHCTFRNGAYIKDLSSVEPDLSKVMIIDNSPLSYIFHEDNAIPIEGWINDPTDNDLLHLVPLLEALQYVMDVRALLALRRGEVEASH